MATQKPQQGQNDFATVKAGADLVDYITATSESHAQPAGASTRINPCPHCGHRDCCTVSQQKQLYKCYSCDASGDVFNYHELYFSTDKATALKAVASHYGIPISAPKAQGFSRAQGRSQQSSEGQAPAAGGHPPPSEEDIAQRNRLQAVLAAAVEHYQGVLAKKPEFMAKLKAPKTDGGRGHTDATIARMEIGFTDGQLAKVLEAQGFSIEEIKASGLYVKRKRKEQPVWVDFFMPGVYIFPHRTETGEIGHFTIKDPRKKIDYQLKSEHRLGELKFGNQRAIHQDNLIICEGENDLASFFDIGVTNVLATMGQLAEAQVQWLLKHASGKRFYLFFDNDDKPGANGQPPAGIKYTRKLYMHLLRQPDCEVLVASGIMMPGEDPDDFIHRDIGSAKKRVHNALAVAKDPLTWEISKIPDEIRNSHTATLTYLKEIDFFDSLGQLDELLRDAVMGELQAFGFSRDAVMGAIQEGYNLKEALVELRGAMNEGKTPSEAYMKAAAERVWNWLNDRGKFFVTEGENLHLFYKHVIYQIGGNVPWKALLRREAGLNATQPTTKYVNEEISSLCFDRGERLEEFTWVHHAEVNQQPTLFINLNDPANRIMRLAEDDIQLIENGTNADQVLLAQSHQMKPFKYDPEVDVRAAMRDMKELVFDSMSCHPVQRYLVLAWTLSAFCIPMSEARALMKMEGGSASGKTTAAKYCSLLLYGQNLVGRITGAGAYSMGATEPMLVMDNMETDDLNKMMTQFLLLASTGTTNFKRKGGSDKEVTSETVNCLVAITAIEPFTKPELINRTYLVEFHKKFRRNGFIDEAVSAKLIARRDSILSAWIKILAGEVLPQLDERENLLRYIQENHPQSSKDRVNAFMSLLALIAKCLVKYIPLDEEIAGGKRPERALIDEWVRIQDAYAKLTEAGTNDVLQFLDSVRRDYLMFFADETIEPDSDGVERFRNTQIGLIIERRKARDPDDPTIAWDEYRFEASMKGLLDAFQRHARERGIRAPWKTARQLSSRIKNEVETLEASGWTIHHSRKVRGERFAWFTWSPDEK